MSGQFTHFDDAGNAVMVDVSDKKKNTVRTAIAKASITMSESTFNAIKQGEIGKGGDVLGVARVAGIMAAKKTWDLIPCVIL